MAARPSLASRAPKEVLSHILSFLCVRSAHEAADLHTVSRLWRGAARSARVTVIITLLGAAQSCASTRAAALYFPCASTLWAADFLTPGAIRLYSPVIHMAEYTPRLRSAIEKAAVMRSLVVSQLQRLIVDAVPRVRNVRADAGDLQQVTHPLWSEILASRPDVTLNGVAAAICPCGRFEGRSFLRTCEAPACTVQEGRCELCVRDTTDPCRSCSKRVHPRSTTCLRGGQEWVGDADDGLAVSGWYCQECLEMRSLGSQLDDVE